MPSHPPTNVDWGVLTPRLHDGDRVCGVHGVVDAVQAPIGVPICSHCRQLAATARVIKGHLHRVVEPAPAHCAAAEQHPLAGGRMLVSWTPCACPPAVAGLGGHRTWTCRDCLDLGRNRDNATQCWPPHEDGG